MGNFYCTVFTFLVLFRHIGWQVFLCQGFLRLALILKHYFTSLWLGIVEILPCFYTIFGNVSFSLTAILFFLQFGYLNLTKIVPKINFGSFIIKYDLFFKSLPQKYFLRIFSILLFNSTKYNFCCHFIFVSHFEWMRSKIFTVTTWFHV